jgi:hypothetical protein
MPLLLAVLLSLAQTPERDPGPPAKLLDEAVRAIPGYAAAKALPPVGDEAFLRRVMKDLVDAAPSDAELKAFVDDSDPGKRAKAIERLLKDDRWSASWARRFTRVLIPDLEKNPWTELSGVSVAREGEAVADFTRWLATQLRKEKPWTEIVHEMIDARGALDGDPALAWLLSTRRGRGFPLEFAERLSRDLLGVRIGCARCHDHPYETWRTEDYFALAAFAVRQRAQIVKGELQLTYSDEGEMKLEDFAVKSTGKPAATVIPAKFLWGGRADGSDDRMKFLAGFVTQKSTTQLPRALANRVWSWLLGAGVVNPVDDFARRNMPLSPSLLETMVKLLQENSYSVRHLARVVCNTQAYQMPTPEEAPDGESFRHAAARKAAPQPPMPSTGPLPLQVELPEGWVRVKERAPAKGRFLIPHPTEKGRWAELGLYANALPKEQWASTAGWGWIDPMRTEVTPLEGKGGLKVTFTEVAGPNWCVRGADGPVEFRFWLAEVASAPKPLHFRVAAPADLLDPRRDAFLGFLKSLSAK